MTKEGHLQWLGMGLVYPLNFATHALFLLMQKPLATVKITQQRDFQSQICKKTIWILIHTHGYSHLILTHFLLTNECLDVFVVIKWKIHA